MRTCEEPNRRWSHRHIVNTCHLSPVHLGVLGPVTLVTVVAVTALSLFYRSCLGVIAPELSRDLGLSPEDLNAVATWLSAQPLPADPKPIAKLPQPPQVACGSASLPAGRVTP